MPSGGRRENAGRPKGAIHQVKKKLMDRIAASSRKLPLEIMLEAMEDAYKSGGAVEAFPLAEKVAPYLHPKMQAVEVSGADGKPIEQRIEIVRTVIDPVTGATENY
jgi:hypothetical protein